MPILSHIFCSFSDKSSELQLISFNSHLILSFFALTSLANSVEVGCGILEEIKPNATESNYFGFNSFQYSPPTLSLITISSKNYNVFELHTCMLPRAQRTK